jgi:hypothetical protein
MPGGVVVSLRTALGRTGDFPLESGTFDLAILADGRRGVFVVEPTTLPIQIP